MAIPCDVCRKDAERSFGGGIGSYCKEHALSKKLLHCFYCEKIAITFVEGLKYYMGDTIWGGDYASCGQHSKEERLSIEIKDRDIQKDIERTMKEEYDPSWPESD